MKEAATAFFYDKIQNYIDPRPMFNPFKYQYMAKLLKFDGENAILHLKSGALDQKISVPISLLPKELQEGQDFTLTFQPTEAAENAEEKTLKRLLAELIR